jgi:hypothetical protein
MGFIEDTYSCRKEKRYSSKKCSYDYYNTTTVSLFKIIKNNLVHFPKLFKKEKQQKIDYVLKDVELDL